MGYVAYADLYHFSDNDGNRGVAEEWNDDLLEMNDDLYARALQRVDLVESKALIHAEAKQMEKDAFLQDRVSFATMISLVLPMAFLALAVLSLMLFGVFVLEGFVIYTIPSGLALLVFGLLTFTSMNVRRRIKGEWQNSTRS